MHNDIVEYLRNRMICLAEEKGSLTDPDVVLVSQRLDKYMLQVQLQESVSRASLNPSQWSNEHFETRRSASAEDPYRLVNV